MGKVYILTNDAMPGIIKIGITEMETIEDRIKSLDNTSLPKPFRFHYAIETEKHKEIEKLMHNAFSKFRIRNNREFFEMDPESAVAALKISGANEIKLKNEMIDEKGIVVEEESIQTKKIFTFSQVNIPIGSEIIFTRDENIVCKVISNREIEFEGETYTLSGLAKKLLNGMGYVWKSVQGPMYFKYNEKTLYELRNELEAIEESE
jgi:hypothetical protein